jgi:hypothetical protein
MNIVEVARAIEANALRLGHEILHRQAKGVKFDGNLVVCGDTTNRD